MYWDEITAANCNSADIYRVVTLAFHYWIFNVCVQYFHKVSFQMKPVHTWWPSLDAGGAQKLNMKMKSALEHILAYKEVSTICGLKYTDA